MQNRYKHSSHVEVMPDHVHIFVAANPTLAPHEIAGWLKGYTSFKLRKEFPELKSRLPTLWTRAYYIESVGHIARRPGSEAPIRKYIEDQKNDNPPPGDPHISRLKPVSIHPNSRKTQPKIEYPCQHRQQQNGTGFIIVAVTHFLI